MTYLRGDRVRSTEKFAWQFPRPIALNEGRPLTGTVQRMRSDGLVVVQWDTRVSPVAISPSFVEPETAK